jgi:hypothetical protein
MVVTIQRPDICAMFRYVLEKLGSFLPLLLFRLSSSVSHRGTGADLQFS